MDDTSLILGRLEGKVDSIQATLSAIVQRQDAHESRLSSVEGAVRTIEADRAAMIPGYRIVEADLADLKTWRTTVEGKARGWIEAGSFVKIAVGIAIGIAGYFGFQIAMNPVSPLHSTAMTSGVGIGTR
ncbi:hypothetical protein VH570_00130 [Sphingobium sp. HT1-2]|uniref:hypothetical protein n=1 Tax=Sphingobium sp. HT1-2 TaxID=3111640 RepID=UPI003C1235A1